MELSIIIPVYKVEQYLESCLQSILKQGLKDYEVILVDDCSPDKSGVICDEWVAVYDKFKVIHCERNKGLSEARNRGIEVASGDYITFVDSDDYLAPNTLCNNLELLRENPEVKILEYPVYVWYGSHSSYEYIPGDCELIGFEDWINKKGYVHSFAWNKIYKRDLWKSNSFIVDKVMGDLFTIPYVIRDANKILRSNKGLYYYCDRKGSISNTVSMANVKDFLDANVKLYNEIKTCAGIEKTAIDNMYMQMSNAQIVVLQLGGVKCIPNRRVSLSMVFDTKTSWTMRMKLLVQWLLGSAYCDVIAGLRKLIKKLN